MEDPREERNAVFGIHSFLFQSRGLFFLSFDESRDSLITSQTVTSRPLSLTHKWVRCITRSWRGDTSHLSKERGSRCTFYPGEKEMSRGEWRGLSGKKIPKENYTTCRSTRRANVKNTDRKDTERALPHEKMKKTTKPKGKVRWEKLNLLLHRRSVRWH